VNANVSELDSLLAEHGFEDTGGGRNFTSWEHKDGRAVYVFGTVPGSGPDDSHWVAVKGHATFTAGGFDPESLAEWLTGGGGETVITR
jgi:hypothetical protein